VTPASPFVGRIISQPLLVVIIPLLMIEEWDGSSRIEYRLLIIAILFAVNLKGVRGGHLSQSCSTQT